jgi:hypothetical protein
MKKVKEEAVVGELSACVSRRVANAVGVREPAMQRPAPQHHRRVLPRHRDAPIEMQGLLDCRLVECDEPELPGRDEFAEAPVRFPFAD